MAEPRGSAAAVPAVKVRTGIHDQGAQGYGQIIPRQGKTTSQTGKTAADNNRVIWLL